MTPPYTEQELLQIASVQVREPWERFVRAAANAFAGKEPVYGDDRIALPLTPFTVDYAAMYPVMRDFVGLMTWDPCNLFTIIHDRAREKILRAYLEVTRDNNFVELIRIDTADPLLADVLAISRSEKRETLREILDARCKEKFGHAVNWVKIASIDFFGAMAQGAGAFKEKGLHGWMAAVYDGVREVYEKDLIRFIPEPPAFARLREMMTQVLRIDFRHIDLDALFGDDPALRPSGKTIAIVLKGRDYVTALKLGGRDAMHLTYPKAATQDLADVPMKKLATAARKALGCDLAIALRVEPVANAAFEALYHEMPYHREDTKIVLYRILEIVRQFGKLWSIDPMPFYLKDHVRIPGKLLGSPYDISNLSSWFLPGLFLDGEPLFQGHHNRRTNIILDGTKILSMFTLELYDGGIRSLVSHDPAPFADIFAKRATSGAETKEQAVETAFRLWQRGDGFQNQTIVMQKEFQSALMDLLSIRTFRTVVGLWRVIPAALRVAKIAKSGGIAVVPDLLFRRVEGWIQEVGRPRVYSAIRTIPFDLKRRRTRGLLYIKESVAAAIILSLAVYLIFF